MIIDFGRPLRVELERSPIRQRSAISGHTAIYARDRNGTCPLLLHRRAGRALPLLKQGKLLALGVNTAHPLLRDVPTISDTLPGFEDAGSYVLLAPAATPRPIVKQIANEVTRILSLSDVKQSLLAEGLVPATKPPGEYNETLRSQLDSLAKFVRMAGIKVE